jgi:(4-(4-[2-(gamma-L-glutamylamino)ethyl]phenoxymethyl)furan-2-yl)methanamine synthase
MAEAIVTGWDLGGAHIKAAQMDAAGRLHRAIQIPCTLWRGLEHLEAALARLDRELLASDLHGVTMTGELVDLFADRREGVGRLIEAMLAHYPGRELRFYAREIGFLAPAAARAQALRIASANWHATGRYLAARGETGLLVDIGSTTTDILSLAAGKVRCEGFSDSERMTLEELVYTGVTRTPVMALAETVPFAGGRQRLMAEYFATAADVHRLTGELPEDADQHATADGRGKGAEESAARLARMLGRDLGNTGLAAWRQLARHLAERQRRLLIDAIDRVLSRGLLPASAPVIGAGVGRFLLPEIARRLQRPYRDFADLMQGEPALREWAARAAPAAAVAGILLLSPLPRFEAEEGGDPLR